MPPDRTSSQSIAVVGSGQAAVAALIDAMVAVAYRTPDGSPQVSIFVIDQRDSPIPRGATPFPLDGWDPGSIHPFRAFAPPPGFPTFGQYVADEGKSEAGFDNALVAPTYGQVNKYLDYCLELAAISFADQIEMEIVKQPIRRIEEPKPNGPAIIELADDTRLEVAGIIRARGPLRPTAPPVTPAPGVVGGGPVHLPAVRAALEASGVSYTSRNDPSGSPVDFVISRGAKTFVVAALDPADPEFSPQIGLRLAPAVGTFDGSALWVVTPHEVEARVQSFFRRVSVECIALSRFPGVLERLDVIGPSPSS